MNIKNFLSIFIDILLKQSKNIDKVNRDFDF